MKQDQFTWNWYPWLLVNHSQWTILELLYYSSFLFATLVDGVIGINFVDHSLNQGAPAGHKSAKTPIGHESNGAAAGELSQVYIDTIFEHLWFSSQVGKVSFTLLILILSLFVHNLSLSF